MTLELQLQGDLRQAIENYLGDYIDGPWDAVVETLAQVIHGGQLTLDQASRLSLALANTHGPEKAPDGCPACGGCEGMSW